MGKRLRTGTHLRCYPTKNAATPLPTTPGYVHPHPAPPPAAPSGRRWGRYELIGCQGLAWCLYQEFILRKAVGGYGGLLLWSQTAEERLVLDPDAVMCILY